MNYFKKIIEFIKNLLNAGTGEPNLPPKDELMKGLLTDWGCTINLSQIRSSDAATLRKKYNTIRVVGDQVRPYCFAGRTQRTVTGEFVSNLKQIRSWGFRTWVVLGNEPSVRNGQSASLGITNHTNMTPEQLYSSTMLENEKACWKDLLGKFVPEYISLFLEPSRSASINYQKELARYIRKDLGYKGIILCDGGSSGEWTGDENTNGTSGPITINNWISSKQTVKDADGLTINANSAPNIVPLLTKSPGQLGWCLWFKEYVGSYNTPNPSKLQDWMWKYVA
jgi:hypothetical protein